MARAQVPSVKLIEQVRSAEEHPLNENDADWLAGLRYLAELSQRMNEITFVEINEDDARRLRRLTRGVSIRPHV